ncbi:MAG: hypothetical protein JRH06_16360 [Deltaproteobacteria bacterium]|nr:hypothetical protein [Deltaproteobacteria bacterium]MBW2139110.1 hypothetical protein [Deltaproteobacteria bacterium]
MEVKWCGLDYGECIMNADEVRNPLLFGDIYKSLGHPELVGDRIRKYRVLKEKYGGYPALHEGHRDDIYSYVLDGDAEAIRLFVQKELELKEVGQGLEELLEYLNAQDIEVCVVSELKKSSEPLGSDPISLFLRKKDLLGYFHGLITPLGRLDLKTGSVDLRYKGATKKGGALYDVLAKELGERGIRPSEAVIVGDRPEMDINPARERGFRTIQYTGFVDKGPSGADMVACSFKDLMGVLRGSQDKIAEFHNARL